MIFLTIYSCNTQKSEGNELKITIPKENTRNYIDSIVKAEKFNFGKGYIHNNIDSIFKTEKFQPEKEYDWISLQYKSKPLLRPGQLLTEIDPNFSFGIDVNGDYQDSHEGK